jgi:hypothetical protein
MTAVGSADIRSLAQAIHDSGRNAEATTQSVLISSANYLKAEMEARVPVATGQLRQSIGVRVSGQISHHRSGYRVRSLRGVRDQAARHQAKNKKALAFKVRWADGDREEVHHPGTKAQPFVRPAFDAWVDTLGGLVAEAHISSNYRRSAA